jgi:hypothetical protein
VFGVLNNPLKCRNNTLCLGLLGRSFVFIILTITKIKKTIARYKVQATKVTENETLVKEVYKQLHQEKIEGFHYSTFKLEDGVTFIHIALSDTDEANKAFTNLQAFKNFQAGIKERCDELPVVSAATEVGSYNFVYQNQSQQ